MFTEQIKRLHEERQIPQRKLAAACDIDTATYCKYRLKNHTTKNRLSEAVKIKKQL